MKVSASRPGRFTPRERAPGTHWIEGCVGRRADLDTVTKKRIPSPRRKSNPRTLIVQYISRKHRFSPVSVPHPVVQGASDCISCKSCDYVQDGCHIQVVPLKVVHNPTFPCSCGISVVKVKLSLCLT